MAKNVRNVMAGISKDKQAAGLTLDEIRREFMLAGYGVTKADKRTKELLVSAQIQYNGETRGGKMVFYCIYWPMAFNIVDFNRVGAIYYMDDRHTMLRRRDGVEYAWRLTEEEREQEGGLNA